jgi:hypothetical protein
MKDWGVLTNATITEVQTVIFVAVLCGYEGQILRKADKKQIDVVNCEYGEDCSE